MIIVHHAVHQTTDLASSTKSNKINYKQLKKKGLLILLSIIIIFLGIQIYRYYKYEGNVLVYICNDSNLENVDVTVYLDGVKQISNSFTNEVFHGYKLFPLKAFLGQHTLEVKADKLSINEKVTFRVFFIRAVIIEVLEKLESSNNRNEYEIVISLQHKPLTWID